MSRRKLIQKRREIQHAELNRQRLFKIIMAAEDLIAGSLSDMLVKCGKAGCHCENKPAHPITRLNTRTNGKISNKVVRIDDLARIRQLVQTYKDFKSALKEIETIEAHEKKLFEETKKIRNHRYE